MKRSAAIGFIVACFLVTGGCAAGVVAVGGAAGLGAAYVAGEDTRSYDVEYQKAVKASTETLKSLKMPVTRTQTNESGTTTLAERADGTPVAVEVLRAGSTRSDIGVRTGMVGFLELEASGRIHAAIAHRLRKVDEPAAAASPSPLADVPEKPPEAETTAATGQRSVERPSIALAPRAPPDRTIYFAVDSNELQPSEIAKLDRIVEAIRKTPGAKLSLAGYTDAVGSAEYNQMIAESRASAVKLYFVANGVNPNRISVIGKGARDFVAFNDSEEGRSLNRRVEISISENR